MTDITEITEMPPVRLLWFHFRQNNSGGYFIDDEMVCEDVFIQAVNAAEVRAKAEELFDSRSEYCECCGERWYTEVDESDGHPQPTKYGEVLFDLAPIYFGRKAKLNYIDGHVETYTVGQARPLSLPQ